MKKTFCVVGALAVLAGCAGIDKALFVTTTTIGISADTTPPGISFAYDRVEGFIGPADTDGNMPPAVARIQSNHSLINPQVKQIYATGDAALDATIGDVSKRGEIKQENEIGDDRRVAFFTVVQTTGLKLEFSPNAPVIESLAIGYKRQEASLLPLLGKEGEKAKYPSTLAAINRNVAIRGFSSPDEAPTQNQTSEGVAQFFATGAAARNLAVRAPVRDLIIEEAQISVRDSGSGLLTDRDQVILKGLATQDCDTVNIFFNNKDGCQDLHKQFSDYTNTTPREFVGVN